MTTNLEKQALRFWNVSRACNGHKATTVQKALNELNEVRDNSGEHRVLHQRASDLQGELIIHGGREANHNSNGGNNVEQI